MLYHILTACRLGIRWKIASSQMLAVIFHMGVLLVFFLLMFLDVSSLVALLFRYVSTLRRRLDHSIKQLGWSCCPVKPEFGIENFG